MSSRRDKGFLGRSADSAPMLPTRRSAWNVVEFALTPNTLHCKVTARPRGSIIATGRWSLLSLMSRIIMNKIQCILLLFCMFLGLVIYTEDVGAGSRYWGWVNNVPMGDKFCHYTFMFTFSVLTNLALRCRAIRLGGQTLLLGTAIVTFVVVAEEFSQIWIPGRDFDLLDLAADLVGIVCGALIARRVHGEHRGTAKVKPATPHGA
jgi:polysaccharide biosynthesis protein VpsQ